ncbi:MAG: amidase family protein, partial [Steroidobacteraceae bacterium]
VAAGVPALVSGAEASSSAHRDLSELTATEAVKALRNGEIKAEDYVEALLAQTVRLRALNAFITLHPDEVRQAARDADRYRAQGRTLGLLHGLPIPVKDSIDTKSLPTSYGTRALKHFRPETDAGLLLPLLAQGAIVMGKTDLDELQVGWTSNNATFGPVLNPYDRTRTPGGSSGGSAAAVAARMAPLAIGEDTYGSIRVPATFCGLVGLRPTFGRYPDDGVMPLSRRRFDQLGPLARSVSDVILFDSVSTGDHSAVRPVPLRGIRIGTSQFLMQGIDAECGRIVAAALDRLRGAGVEIVPTELPPSLQAASQVEAALLGIEMFPAISGFLASEGSGVSVDEVLAQAGPNLRRARAPARNAVSEENYRRLRQTQRRMKAEAIAFFRANRIDALAFAPSLTPAFAQGGASTLEINGRPGSTSTSIGRQVAIGSCASLSCLVLPAGMTAGGLPVGLEFDALPGADRRLLSLGLSLESTLGSIPPPPLHV